MNRSIFFIFSVILFLIKNSNGQNTKKFSKTMDWVKSCNWEKNHDPCPGDSVDFTEKFKAAAYVEFKRLVNQIVNEIFF